MSNNRRELSPRLQGNTAPQKTLSERLDGSYKALDESVARLKTKLSTEADLYGEHDTVIKGFTAAQQMWIQLYPYHAEHKTLVNHIRERRTHQLIHDVLAKVSESLFEFQTSQILDCNYVENKPRVAQENDRAAGLINSMVEKMDLVFSKDGRNVIQMTGNTAVEINKKTQKDDLYYLYRQAKFLAGSNRPRLAKLGTALKVLAALILIASVAASVAYFVGPDANFIVEAFHAIVSAVVSTPVMDAVQGAVGSQFGAEVALAAGAAAVTYTLGVVTKDALKDKLLAGSYRRAILLLDNNVISPSAETSKEIAAHNYAIKKAASEASEASEASGVGAPSDGKSSRLLGLGKTTQISSKSTPPAPTAPKSTSTTSTTPTPTPTPTSTSTSTASTAPAASTPTERAAPASAPDASTTPKSTSTTPTSTSTEPAAPAASTPTEPAASTPTAPTAAPRASSSSSLGMFGSSSSSSSTPTMPISGFDSLSL